ncbi:two-component system CheB/CheR fusion protein [Aquabacterium commune]|uniref:Two-component system CheB/CheR fusion protein n=1 Tax=Aquabacterium commune TaxID=70586 RepID=A0A4R6RKD4_9BURK|nr:chemotaxis protein CheB [Aquabacterium commune]TDP86136.1 two-component system CheB/CheR fusion protein [Aquabacterium commune]
MMRPSVAEHHPPTDTPRVVGLGASAGGLAALEAFFEQVPLDSGMAYVVVQHLDPTRETLLVSLLQRVTQLPVREVTDGMLILANTVYVIPPAREMTVAKGHLHLSQPQHPRGQRLPIDVLFSSLAQDQGERAIGVVLSGMGSDGTLGLEALHTSGGLTLAQQPASAQFDGMPRSAIASGCVAIVALPAELPQRILQVLASTRPDMPVAMPADEAPALDTILGLLKAHSKHDMSLYKSSTLLRRIGRRMAVHGLGTMGAYAELLSHSPQELDLLFAEMLIGVTRFFRDDEVWEELAARAMPAMLAQHGAHGLCRAWVVGCSTGEEAYSLAMLFKEAQDAHPEAAGLMLQVFATDLSADAVAVARKGQYPARIATEMSAQRLARFFTAHEGGWRIHKDIRDMVLFAQHDVILDPPFTRLDLVSCRNVLIYFNAELQQRLMPLFHYSLRPGGVLLLGGCETVGRAQSMFTALSAKHRLYQRNDDALATMSVDFPVKPPTASRHTTQEALVSSTPMPPNNLQTLADHVLLQTHAPAAVLVNEAGDILYINGRTGRYLEPAAGKANWNIHVMARSHMRTQLAVALREAIAERKTVTLSGLTLDSDPLRTLSVTVQSLQEPRALAGTVLIVFKEVSVPPAHTDTASAAGSTDTARQQELDHARGEIEALRREMQASREELQAANEALQSANEELQSTNEELTTSKEEAQSMNEELQTINGELQTKLDDLAMAQSDMQNLLNSTDIATLFLDNDLNVRRFTEQATGLFHLRDSDIGRPLSDLNSKLNYPELHQDAKATLRTLTPTEKQIATTDARWLAVRIMPYRTVSNMIQGVVLTFVDITASKALESQLRKA